MERTIYSLWHALLMAGLIVAVTLGSIRQELLAGVLLISVYLVCYTYAIYRAVREKKSDLMIQIFIVAFPYGILTAYYNLPFLPGDSIIWVAFVAAAILGITNLIVRRAALR